MMVHSWTLPDVVAAVEGVDLGQLWCWCLYGPWFTVRWSLGHVVFGRVVPALVVYTPCEVW